MRFKGLPKLWKIFKRYGVKAQIGKIYIDQYA